MGIGDRVGVEEARGRRGAAMRLRRADGCDVRAYGALVISGAGARECRLDVDGDLSAMASGAELLSCDIDVAGRVPIRPSRTFLPLLGGWLAILGVVLFWFGGGIGPIFQAIAVIIAVAGIGTLLLALTGFATAGYLQFDPDALTIAQRRWAARIPWDDIVRVQEGEYQSNPMLLITVAAPAELEIVPAKSRDLAMHDIARTGGLMGADFAVMTWHYGIALPVLAETVARYVNDATVRAELRPRLTQRI